MPVRFGYLAPVSSLLIAFQLYAADAAGPSIDPRSPEAAVASFDLADGLQATLFASEPQIRSLTNMDIDPRGRVWVCEVENYRGRLGSRPEGDRILILEDTDGDGKSDSTKVYFQGPEVDSALGICVLGNRVIVSCSPNIWIFTDQDGDDRPDERELLFSNTGQAQHDHSAHAFVFGPDGKLYWNFGNSGKAVHDAAGRPVLDRFGIAVNDQGKPYRDGMAFRCNMDGSAFEVLGHNFRNNYELAVDAFGSLWQSDNDDDGHQGVRINYLLEYGNYGYHDELTGASWEDPRTGREAEIPRRHWHLHDPGVVPNLLQTGGGSPTGILVYEGDLLPEVFRNQVIHADAGPNIVRSYPVEVDGAGYRARMVNIMHGVRDNWFRPADVCIAPDGSLFVADWYDPGVGGHGMADLERGRIYRLAPPGHQYQIPQYDWNTAKGAIDGLMNPCVSVRHAAWMALQRSGGEAAQGLQERAQRAANPRHRARALWAWGKLTGSAAAAIRSALRDADPQVRLVALRLADQTGHDLVPVIRQLVHDKSAAVRRQCAIALRQVPSPDRNTARLWSDLACQHDGRDRWYLEALGIGAAHQWDACFAVWLNQVGDKWNTPAGRDIVWRSRAQKSAEYLARIMVDPAVPTEELPRYFRACDFLSADSVQPALTRLATAKIGDRQRQRAIDMEVFPRLQNFDVVQHADRFADALDGLSGTMAFVELIDKYQVSARFPQLLAMGADAAAELESLAALRLLLRRGQVPLLREYLDQADPEQAVALATNLGRIVDDSCARMLLELAGNSEKDLALRRAAAQGAAASPAGAQAILQLARDNGLSAELREAVALRLHRAADPRVREDAKQLFPLPVAKNAETLPPIENLVRIPGNVDRGRLTFQQGGGCAKCHVVNGQGTAVGPDLSQIGNKLGREALAESILFPNASISHSYETRMASLTNGEVIGGILVSETADGITLKTGENVIRQIPRADIEELTFTPTSLMPADLQQTMTLQELVDVIEYLTTLRP